MINKLGVIIKARDLADYIFLIIDKSPKKFGMTLASRLHNLSLDIIEQLVRADNVRLSDLGVEIPENKVSLKSGLHNRLHRKKYYTMVNKRLKSAYYGKQCSHKQRVKRVKYALLEIKSYLLRLNAVAPF